MEVIIEHKAGVDLWKFSGSLKIQSVQELKMNAASQTLNAKRRLFDLSQVDSCDTAGVQFLCVMLQESKNNDIKVDIPVWPESIQIAAKYLGINIQSIAG